MSLRSIARVLTRTPLAPMATFPKRAWSAIRHSTQVTARTFLWLFNSREHTNYSYELTPANREHLCWFVANVSGCSVSLIHSYIEELENSDFRERVRQAVHRSPRRYLWDREIRLGSRLGWYALVRAIKPRHVVEAGIDRGLGTAILAEALQRNSADGHNGRITAIDINPNAGDLISGTPWAEVVELIHDDSVAAIRALDGPVDLFIHDSLYTDEHERAELEALMPLLSEKGMVVNAKASTTLVFPAWALAQGWNFLVFSEEPDDHWYPGDSVGIGWR